MCFTWPLAPDLSTRLVAHFDPPFSAWRLARVVHNVSEGRPLFDGEIFWPARQTLAYSDAMLAQAVLAWPLLASGLTPLAVLNVLTLAGVAGSATAAYVLARRLSGHTGGALVAGLVFAFAPYRRDHLQHVELQWALWTPLALWAWHRALDGGRARDGLLCAAFVLLQLLSCIYYGVFLACRPDRNLPAHARLAAWRPQMRRARRTDRRTDRGRHRRSGLSTTIFAGW